MRSKWILVIGVLVLALGACSPLKTAPNTPSATQSPVPVLNTPTPLPTSTNTPLPAPPDLALASSPALVDIKFLDANNGWGIASDDSGSILRTVDGGATWYNATPPDLTGLGYSTSLYVLDVNHVWMVVPNADYFTGKLYRTSDAGLTWTTFDVPFGGGRLQFLDANTGRILADLGAAAGSQAVELFQTSDGGATWLSVFNDHPTRPDASNSLPFSGIKNGMTFLDLNTGWVTGTIPVGGEVYLFITHDGGIDWAMQNIPLPAGFESYQYMPQAPVFFGNDGFLPLTIYLSNTTSSIFYVTHDGGISWNGEPTDAARLIPPGQFAFSDNLHGWSWDGGPDLYFTADGAQTWSKIPTKLDLADRLAQLVFVPGTSGQFIGWALTGPDDAGHSQLYKTTDNGSTWTTLIP
jgi:photosystem II stability/assembly factor-like uncharacterized protein